MRRLQRALVLLAMVVQGCVPASAPSASPTGGPASTGGAAATPGRRTGPTGPTREEHRSGAPVVTGVPIDPAELAGRIVFDDFEDLFAMDADGTDVLTLAGDSAGPEFDGAWSPDGEWVVYRDSTRGINANDEIAIVRADGSGRRLLTTDPANDWGPDWSPDGSTIVFNSDRDGSLRGFLMDPDGSNVRPVGVQQWFEYPSWSPDGARIVFEGALGATYDLFVLEVATGDVTRLTDAPGDDSWPVWSPDGTQVAFSSERDDCDLAPSTQDCWDDGEPNDHHRDVWLMNADGSDQRRVTPEIGQFVAWSPDGRHLLVSGRALYVVRPDGTGRLELRADGIPHALGGIPDWWGPVGRAGMR